MNTFFWHNPSLSPSTLIHSFNPGERERVVPALYHTAPHRNLMSRSWDSFPGLLAVLDSPAWPIDQSCAAVERCLLVNRDSGRSFFESCFPALLRNVFGLEGNSWLGMAARVSFVVCRRERERERESE